MPDFHLSKSEIFFYGALAYSLHPLMPSNDPKATKSLSQLFPALGDLWPENVDPFSTLEQLAVDFGIARRPEWDPAGDDEERPWNPEFRESLPEDTVWTLADGSPISPEEFADIAHRLEAVFEEARGVDDDTESSQFAAETMLHPAQMLNMLTGVPQWVTRNLHERCFKEYTDSLGPFVIEGESPSEPGYVYRLSWRGIMYRYKVTQQTNPLYESLVHQFCDELKPPRTVLLSLMKPPVKAGRSIAPRLAPWLGELEAHYGETPEWNVAHSLAAARRTARTLEQHITQHDDVFAAMLAKQESLQRMSTREQLDDFFEYISDIVEDRVDAFRNSGRKYSEPTSEEMPFLNARALCLLSADMMYSAAEGARDLSLTEVATLAEGGGDMARRFDQTLKEVTFGAHAIQKLRQGSRDLGDLASNAMRLAYGQLFFSELAENQVYIDPATKAAVLRQPKPVRTQLAEAISQFERQTLANCSVTSACGLIEPIVRKMAAAWLPPGNYSGDTADVLKLLLSHLLEQQRRLRNSRGTSDIPSDGEPDLMLKIYCVNLAFGLHTLGNTVRHYAHKTLDRHDAGVMLHGLCALLQRLDG